MAEQAFILGEACDVREVLATPGIYVAPSGSPSYGALLALTWKGLAEQLGRRQLADGQLAIAVRVPEPGAYRPNASGSPDFLSMTHITVDDEVFANTLSMYADWREAWWREAIQNSVDAGATEIRLGVRCLDENEQMIDLGTDVDPDRSTEDTARIAFIEVSCEDNGSGMDQETLATKFLAVGGTGKGSVRSSAVGGFGEAKKLLIGLWVRWYLRTGQEGQPNSFECVDGHGLRFTPRHAPPFQGTQLHALMRVGESAGADHARAFVAKCSLPGIVVTMNGVELPQGRATSAEEPLFAWMESDERLQSRLDDVLGIRNPNLGWNARRELIRDKIDEIVEETGLRPSGVIPNALDALATRLNTRRTRMRIYYSAKDTATPGKALLRVSGISAEGLERSLYMFPRTFAEVPGTAIIELSGDSKAMLLANRESLLREGAGYAIDSAIDEWIQVVTADKRQALERQLAPILYEGEGLFEASQDAAASLALALGAFEMGPKFKPVDIDAMLRAMAAEQAAYNEAMARLGKQLPNFSLPSEAALQAAFDAVDLRGPSHIEQITKTAAWRPNFMIILGPDGDRPAPELLPERMPPKLVQLQKFWAEIIRFILINLGEDVTYGVGWTIHPKNGGAHLKKDGVHWLVMNPYREPSRHSAGFRSLTNEDDVAHIYSLALHEVGHIKFQNHYDEWGNYITETLVPRALWNKQKYIERIRKAVLARASMKSRGGREILSGPKGLLGSRDVMRSLPTLAQLQAFFGKKYRDSDTQNAIAGMVAWARIKPGEGEEPSNSRELETIASVVKKWHVSTLANYRADVAFLSNEEVALDGVPRVMMFFWRSRSIIVLEAHELDAESCVRALSYDVTRSMLREGTELPNYPARQFHAVRLGTAMRAFLRVAGERLEVVRRYAEQVIEAAVDFSVAAGGSADEVRASNLVSCSWGAGFAMYIPTAMGPLVVRPLGDDWLVNNPWDNAAAAAFEDSNNAMGMGSKYYVEFTFDRERGALK